VESYHHIAHVGKLSLILSLKSATAKIPRSLKCCIVVTQTSTSFFSSRKLQASSKEHDLYFPIDNPKAHTYHKPN